MISFSWFGKSVQFQLKIFSFHHSKEFQVQSKGDLQCWSWNLQNLQLNLWMPKDIYIYIIMNIWWCQGDKYICHSDIFKFLCLFFFLAPKVKQVSVPWHIYSSCGCLGYHPVRAWPISNYAGAQRIKIVSWLQIPCAQVEKSNTQSSGISLISFYYGQTSDIWMKKVFLLKKFW